MPARVMIVEDERIVAFDMQQRLRTLGYDVPAVASSGDEAVSLFEATRPDCVLMDIRIKGPQDGIETAHRLSAIAPVPIVYLTAHSEDSTLERASKTHPYGYLLKPFTERELHATIQMALERSHFQDALQRSEQRLRLALDAAQLGIVDIDARTSEVELGNGTAAILGIPAVDHTTCHTILATVDAEDRGKVLSTFAACKAATEARSVEFRRSDEQGQVRWIRAEGRGFGASHAHRHVVGVLRDVTERKAHEERILRLNEELERTVGERTAALQASMEELRSFSYSVAHDLRAPLRAVIGFSERVKEDHAAGLDAEARDYVNRITAAGKRMSEVIDALLELSRITRVPLSRQGVNLSALVRDELGRLAEEDPTRTVDIVVEDGVEVLADTALLRIAIENLVRNAWKFTSRTPSPRIHFGVGESAHGRACFVRDNGAGFDSTRADQLFVAFRRLHPAREYEGLGVGLATVHRIIQRHGGRIWAEAAPGQGATFWFTLGEAEPARTHD